MISTAKGNSPPHRLGSLDNDEIPLTHVDAPADNVSPGSPSPPVITTPDNSQRSTRVDPHPSAADSSDPFDLPGPPPLNYTVRTKTRERYIIIFFVLIFVETCVLPLILFYSLRWGAHLSITKNLAIITSLIGTVSGLKLGQRQYNLWFRQGHESRRPIGAGRWGVDAFQVLISIALFAFFVPLIVGSSLSPANVSTVAMALPFFMLTFCIPLLITGIWDRHLRVPFRVSSLPKHQVLPPLTYTITEDVVAVDGGGGLMYRQAWRHRYEASRVLRRVCRVTAIAWGVSGCVVASGCIAAAWTAPTDTAYGLGYSMPWLWALLVSAWTIHYVHDALKCEKLEWEVGRAHKEMELHLKEKEVDREVDVLQRMRRSMAKEDFDRLLKDDKERRKSMEHKHPKRASLGERAMSDPFASAEDDTASPQRPSISARSEPTHGSDPSQRV